MHHDPAALPLEQQLHAGQAPLDLSDSGDGADGIEALGGDLLGVLALADGEDETLGSSESRLDRAHRPGPARAQRGRHAGKEHHFAKWENGKGESLGHSVHSFFLPASGSATPAERKADRGGSAGAVPEARRSRDRRYQCSAEELSVPNRPAVRAASHAIPTGHAAVAAGSRLESIRGRSAGPGRLGAPAGAVAGCPRGAKPANW